MSSAGPSSLSGSGSSSSGPAIPVPPFDGCTVDVEQWFKKFEQISLFNGWSGSKKAAAMGLCFTGVAAQWFELLPDKVRQSDDEIAKALLLQYRPAGAEQRAQEAFLSRFQGREEEVRTYATSIRFLAKRSNVSDKDTLAQFIRGLRPELKKAVLLSKAQSIDDAVEAATMEEFASHAAIERPSTSQSTVAQVYQPEVDDHSDSTNDDSVTGQVDDENHLVQAIRRVIKDELFFANKNRLNNYQQRSSSSQPWTTTFNNQQHQYNNRRNNRSQRGSSGGSSVSGSKTCWVCGSPDHFARRCPNRKN